VAAPTPIAKPRLTNTIVFQTVSGGPIYTIKADGSHLRHLTTGIDPVLSPDGQQVAFTRWEETQHGAAGSLWVINVDGTGERTILSDLRQPKSPTWSPDEKQIAINMQHGGWLEPKRVCSHSPPPTQIFDKDEYDLEVIIEDSGKTKYCYTLPPNPFWGLRVVDVATGAYEDLLGDNHSFSPAWDPANEERLVFDGDWGLVNLDANQGTTWSLTDDVCDHSPVFSPAGDKIVVTYKQHDHWEIQVLNAAGSGRARLTKTPLRTIVDQRIKGEEPRSWNNVAPAWSPDASQIAFLTDRTGRWEIWVMAADGSNQRPLFPANALDGLTLQYHSVDERMLSWR
jgi:Tol biopolymer transport system component